MNPDRAGRCSRRLGAGPTGTSTRARSSRSWPAAAPSCHGAAEAEGGLAAGHRRRDPQGRRGRPRPSSRASRPTACSSSASPRPTRRRGCRPRASRSSRRRSPRSARWIDSGAKAPDGETAARDPRDHWAFRPPVRPGRPRGRPPGTNPIDAFLGVEQRRIGLTPRPRADKAELLRRVTLDLTGLAPSREELRAFLADPAADAYEKAVDRLLASPRYGERWGRHWMDVWRYSDWDGFAAEIRESRPYIWHWRDWIVESLNADLGYDRMVVLMLAADEAAPEDDAALRATGFLARNWDKFSRVRWLDNDVEHTAKAFLGLTLACARCHDHKYDPIPQTDYYRFRAFFEPHEVREDRLPLGPDAARDGLPRAYDAKPDEPDVPVPPRRRRPTRQVAGRSRPACPISSPRDADPARAGPHPERSRGIPMLRDVVKDELRARAAKAVEDAEAGPRRRDADRPADRRGGAAASRRPPTRPRRPGSGGRGQARRAARPRGRSRSALAGQAGRGGTTPRREAELRLAKAQSGLAAARKAAQAGRRGDDRPSPPPRRSWPPPERPSPRRSRRRRPTRPTTRPSARPTRPRARAGGSPWRAGSPSPDNPLTARVAVNHVWARHFGRPLVGNMFDFGLNGQPPDAPRAARLAGRPSSWAGAGA